MDIKKPAGRPKTKVGPQLSLTIHINEKSKKRLEDMAAIQKKSMTEIVENLINKEYQRF